MINAQYKKDLHGYYLIMPNEKEDLNYSHKMLINNEIKGLLKFELHIVDNMNQYYYDITSMQSLSHTFERGLLKYDQIKKIMKDILNAIKSGKEYLLSENDYVLDPDYIYIKLPSYDVSCCYLVGYKKDILEQLSNTIEYLMNKVDYNDEQGVLFIYGLYKISREEFCTFDKLIDFIDSKLCKEVKDNKAKISREYNVEINDALEGEVLINKHKEELNESNENNDKFMDILKNKNSNKNKGKNRDKSKYKNKYEQEEQIQIKGQNKKNITTFNIPFMQEKLQSEEEVLIYSNKTIATVVSSILVFLGLILIGFKLGLYENKLNERVDITKLFGFILVLGTIESYLLSKLLLKKNRVTKMKDKIEYINNIIEIESNPEKGKYLDRLEFNNKNKIDYNNKKIDYSDNKKIDYNDNKKDSKNKYNADTNQSKSKQEEIFIDFEAMGQTENKTSLLDDYDIEKTALLMEDDPNYKLSSMNSTEYKDIELIEFPFFVGKLNNQVDGTIMCNVISRFHAKIDQKGEEFFITDLNSTNGTFINTERLKANETKVLHLNDEVKFANISFRFEMD